MTDTSTNPFGAAVKSLTAGLAKHHSGTLSDFTIYCKKEQWPVHRLILAMHSSVLAAACSKNFKEAAERSIDLSVEDTGCVKALVNYCYHLDYEVSLTTGTTTTLDFHINMCILADKYDVQPLKMLATSKFKQYLRAFPQAPADLARVARSAYEAPGPTKGIRNEIVQQVVVDDILAMPISKNEIESAMRSCADLATDIAKAQHARPSLPKVLRGVWVYTCGDLQRGQPFYHSMLDRSPTGSFHCRACSARATGLTWKERAQA